MLTDKKVKAFVLASDAVKAKEFYRQILGFKLNSEDDYGLEFDMNHSLLRVSITKPEEAVPQKNTVLGWTVPDIYSTLELLKDRGVKFEKYEFMRHDEKGIWTAPDGTKVAWFKDPNGNVLSIDEKK